MVSVCLERQWTVPEMSVHCGAASAVTVKPNSRQAVFVTVAASVGCWLRGCESCPRSLSLPFCRATALPSWPLLFSPLCTSCGASCCGQLQLLPRSPGWFRRTSCLFYRHPCCTALGGQLAWSLTSAHRRGHPSAGSRLPCTERGRASTSVSGRALRTCLGCPHTQGRPC